MSYISTWPGIRPFWSSELAERIESAARHSGNVRSQGEPPTPSLKSESHIWLGHTTNVCTRSFDCALKHSKCLQGAICPRMKAKASMITKWLKERNLV